MYQGQWFFVGNILGNQSKYSKCLEEFYSTRKKLDSTKPIYCYFNRLIQYSRPHFSCEQVREKVKWLRRTFKFRKKATANRIFWEGSQFNLIYECIWFWMNFKTFQCKHWNPQKKCTNIYLTFLLIIFCNFFSRCFFSFPNESLNYCTQGAATLVW